MSPQRTLNNKIRLRCRMAKDRKDSESIERRSDDASRKNDALSRRGLLKKTAGALLGAAAAGLTGALDARAQVEGLYTSNKPPELPLPMGSLTYLDRKQYIHNREVISHISGSSISGG